jgi:hypothetical protein
MVAGERQFVNVAVVVPDSFSMSRSAFRARHFIHNGHCWTSQQWHPATGGRISTVDKAAG